jgi:hypothetical protein
LLFVLGLLKGAIQYDRAYLRGIGDGRMIERQDWSEGRLRLNGRSVEQWNG